MWNTHVLTRTLFKASMSTYISGKVHPFLYTHPHLTHPPFQELVQILKDDSKQPHRDYLVVDVRDDDFAGGNIRGALHAPSADFLRSVDTLVRTTKDVPLLIFTCALSQSRQGAPPFPRRTDTLMLL
jgi:hypothetical protein